MRQRDRDRYIDRARERERERERETDRETERQRVIVTEEEFRMAVRQRDRDRYIDRARERDTNLIQTDKNHYFTFIFCVKSMSTSICLFDSLLLTFYLSIYLSNYI